MMKPFAALNVVLRPSHPGNIGSAARALKTMGFHRLTLVAPKQFPHPQAEALASGAVDVLHKPQSSPKSKQHWLLLR